jgi:hypothetical protein
LILSHSLTFKWLRENDIEGDALLLCTLGPVNVYFWTKDKWKVWEESLAETQEKCENGHHWLHFRENQASVLTQLIEHCSQYAIIIVILYRSYFPPNFDWNTWFRRSSFHSLFSVTIKAWSLHHKCSFSTNAKKEIIPRKHETELFSIVSLFLLQKFSLSISLSISFFVLCQTLFLSIWINIRLIMMLNQAVYTVRFQFPGIDVFSMMFTHHP